MRARQDAVEFFWKNAGYAYDPKTQTREQGRIQCARRLAQVESDAKDGGFTFEWSVDHHTDSSDWIEDNEDGGKNNDPWQTWQCVIRNDKGQIVNSLHGIDFGRDGQPWGQTYRRVVEAELAVDGLHNEPQGRVAVVA